MIGETVGPYNIVSELGRGGMGVVYLAEHRHLGRPAAIKFLLRELSESAELLNRFFTEARAASLVEHDGIVRVFDCDVHPSGNAYIVMEYLDGQTLRRYLGGRGPLPVPEAAAIMLRVADALTAAHAKGIVHRDIKPDNIFVLSRPPGAIKIVDFGIAKLSPAAQKMPSTTQSGIMLGTPLYMSPEQARGAGNVDERTDVYSLGCILYEMLSGRPPFVQRSAAELMMAHMAQTPAPLDASFPPPLRVLVKGMLAKNPDDRPDLRGEVIPTLQAASGMPGFEPAVPTPPRHWPPPTHTMPMMAQTHATPSTVAGVGLSGGEGPRSGTGRWFLAVTFVGLTVAGAVFWNARRESPPPLPAGPVVSGAAETSRDALAPPPEELAPAPSPPTMAVAEAEPAAVPPAAAPIDRPSRAARAEPPDDPSARQRSRAVAYARPAPRLPPSLKSSSRALRPTALEQPQATVRVALVSDPPGSYVCVPGQPWRVGVTNATLELKADPRRSTLLIYHPGYHIERVTIDGDQDTRRAVKLRPLDNDDLQAPPPCK